MKNYQNESGRSMVEMLGVLAIIGVLSVGGIAGYTMAMNKHKANELLNEASKRAVVVSGYLLSGKEGSIAEFTDPSGYQFGYATVDGENKFKLTLKTSAGVKIDESICAQIKNVVGGEHTNPSVNDECTEFTYNNDLGDASNTADATPEPEPFEESFCINSDGFYRNGYCYFHTDMRWSDAKDFCKNLGGNHRMVKLSDLGCNEGSTCTTIPSTDGYWTADCADDACKQDSTGGNNGLDSGQAFYVRSDEDIVKYNCDMFDTGYILCK